MSLKQFLNTLSKDWRYSRIPQKDEESLSRIRYGSDDNLTEMESSQEVREEAESSSSPSPSPSPPPPPPSTRLNCEELAKEDGDEDSVDNVNIYETFRLSLQFIILWFSANLVTNASLSYTSVASQTILSSTSSFFTLIIGYLVSIEQINQNKIVGILLSFAGVLIVTKVDTAEDNPNNGQNTSILLILWGNLLAIIGAVIYGIYTILLKFKITIPNSHKEKNLNTHLFFGFVGLVCLLGFWPILIILHFTGVEKFSLPQSSSMAQLLVSNAAITFISDFCWCNAVLLTSPLTVTVGLSMTIPLALIGDWVFKGFQINFIYVFGAAIVTIGFLIINKEEEQDFIEDE
ncbi:hypothetical protein KGF56_001027 [Candida oxycetoniae]|uniref:EamA domain-containing protein n=1 Tax=Candida oxycetoniae TaxID=497107 RepID=A0AAI9T0H4_9ASCO|nr:uncharacterized protein KGF56_001027 [Candida oxycetoniae]KAI3406185.2 hypothetical protein KGF56_001027 [Candida oxycetoniae]